MGKTRALRRHLLLLTALGGVQCGETTDNPCSLESVNAHLARGEHVVLDGCEIHGTIVVSPGSSLEATDSKVIAVGAPALEVDLGSVSGLSLAASGPVAVVVVGGFDSSTLTDLEIDARDAAAGLALVNAGAVEVARVRIQGGTYGVVGSRLGDLSDFPRDPGEPGAATMNDVRVDGASIGVWIEIGHVELRDLHVTGHDMAGVVLDVATLALISSPRIEGGEVGLLARGNGVLALEGGEIVGSTVSVQVENERARLTGTLLEGGEVGVRAIGSTVDIEDSVLRGHRLLGLHARSGSLGLARSSVMGTGFVEAGVGDAIQLFGDTAPRLEDVELVDSGRIGLLWGIPSAAPSSVGNLSVQGESLGAIAQSTDAVFPQGEWSVGVVRADAMRARDEAVTSPLALTEAAVFPLESLDLRELGFDPR